VLSERLHSENRLGAVLDMARDLTIALEPEERYQRILSSAHSVIPFDAACLLRLEGDQLVPIAASGLRPSTLETRFNHHEHPRLDVILRSSIPVRFDPQTTLPDPFDGLIEGVNPEQSPIHACAGCAVTDEGAVIGVLTFDALDASAFDDVDNRDLETWAALAGAAMRIATLLSTMKQKIDHSAAVAENLHKNIAESTGEAMIGSSLPMRRLINDIDVVAPSLLPVLITGETGVGKELVARRIHTGSDRRNEPLIQVNCAALPLSIAESELFGHVKGAFTGAHADRLGKFEIADEGTLFLDEIGELPFDLQGKLLRVIQNGEVQRVGSDELIKVDVRLIAATNRDLQTEVREGRFRADLYHRLAGFPIHVAPLRERRNDIPLLADHFAGRCRRRLGVEPVRISAEAMDQLTSESWMGNVRELDNVISRGMLRAARDGSTSGVTVLRARHLDIRPESLPAAVAVVDSLSPVPGTNLGFSERCDLCKRTRINESLEKNDGNWAAAARTLGMHRSNLHRLASRLGMKSESD